MRILFDHNVPAPLRRYLSGHQIDTARERGWEALSNGSLLTEAEGNNYEVFIIADQSIRYQQNLTRFRIAVLVLTDNLWLNVRQKTADVQEMIDLLQPGEYRELEI